MSRMIDADALIDGYKHMGYDPTEHPEESYMEGWCKGFNSATDHCMHHVIHAPTIEPEPHWIPCKERMPEEYGEYRITWTTSASKKRFVGDSEYEVTSEWDDEHYRFKGEWLLDDYIKNYPDVKVIAWKPLEEPYREGE